MPYRLVSPDRKLYLVDNEEDLKGVGKLYGLTSKQLGNVRQLLSWTGVGNHSGDRNDRTERKEAENFQILSRVRWLKHDASSEPVPVVGKPPHIFDNVVTPHPDMTFAYKSLLNLLNWASSRCQRMALAFTYNTIMRDIKVRQCRLNVSAAR